MNNISKALAVGALLIGVMGVDAHAKTDGILVVGTQAEVKSILRGTSLRPEFSEQNDEALVAVQLSHGKMKVFEGEAAEAIVRFIGKVVKGGVVLTLRVGSALWELLEETVGFVFHVGELALKGACWILTHTTVLVIDGVTFVAKTAVAILRAIGDLLTCAIHCP